MAFLNKMDRMGANPHKGVAALREKLYHNAVLMQLPIGAEENFKGVVDLITKQAYYFDGENGEKVRIEDVPADMVDQVAEFRGSIVTKNLRSTKNRKVVMGEGLSCGLYLVKTPTFFSLLSINTKLV
jgi:translation elongation factor EF-G